MTTERKRHLPIVRDARQAPPVVVPAPRLPGVAVGAEHLEVVRGKRELRVEDARLDVVDVEFHSVAPLRSPTHPALRPAAVRVMERVQPERFVSEFAPLSGRVEDKGIHDVRAI